MIDIRLKEVDSGRSFWCQVTSNLKILSYNEMTNCFRKKWFPVNISCIRNCWNQNFKLKKTVPGVISVDPTFELKHRVFIGMSFRIIKLQIEHVIALIFFSRNCNYVDLTNMNRYRIFFFFTKNTIFDLFDKIIQEITPSYSFFKTWLFIL